LKNIKITKNPYLLFLPFLLAYSVFIILNCQPSQGDETRYLFYTNNLLHGFYSPTSNISLISGPGYPIFLMPFVALHIPKIYIVLMNAVFQYLSIIFLFKTLQQFFSFKITLILCLFWACYFNILEYIALIYTESFTLLLISMLMLFLVKAFSPDNLVKANKYIILSGITIGYIALSKIIVGYVLLFMLVGMALIWITNRKVINYRKGVIIMLIAFTTFGPYLFYTSYLTGRLFYMGTGSDNLYWLTTPHEREYGNYITPAATDSLRFTHRTELIEIKKDSGLKRDDAYKSIAINNIKSHPVKFLKNCLSNIGRILFNYPYSYTFQKPGTLLRLPLNGIIVVCMLFCVAPTLMNWRKIPFSIRFMLFFTFLYLGGSVFGSAETRMFTMVVPVLLFWIAYIIQKSTKIKLKFDENSKG
jgi:4-amino-4-deoxy-L-arabinose transferase-like glycosyltransferase